MIVGAAALLAGDYFLPVQGVLFAFFAVILAPVMVREVYLMCESSLTSPFAGFGIFCAVMLMALQWLALPGSPGSPGSIELLTGNAELEKWLAPNLLPFGLTVAVLGSLWLQATKRENERTFESISSTLFGLLYVWFLGGHLVSLRHVGADGLIRGEGWNASGLWLLGVCLACCKLSDIAAFLVGRKFGRHKMIKRISPGKSYEGGVAGLVAGTALSVLAQWAGLLPFPHMWQAVVYGFFVTLFGVLGDLAESLLKRGCGTKDSGSYIPAFGGLLDVVDSILMGGAAAYYLASVMLRCSR